MGANRLRWLIMTPLLRPVVPDVNRITDSASRSAHSAQGSLQTEVL